MALWEIDAIVMSAPGRTAMPTALPEMTLPSMLLPAPERERPNVLLVRMLAAMYLRCPQLICRPSEYPSKRLLTTTLSLPSRISMPCDGSGLASVERKTLSATRLKAAPRVSSSPSPLSRFVALNLVVHRGGGGGIAIAVVAREHHAGAAAIADDAVVVNRVAARAVDQHADAEVANFQPADVDALGVDQSEAGIGGRAHVGAVLAGDGARAGLRALVFDIAGAVEDDEFAAALPR